MENEVVDVEYTDNYNKSILKRHNNFVKQLKLVFFTGATWGVSIINTILSIIYELYLLAFFCGLIVIFLSPNRKILDKKLFEYINKK